MESNDADPGRDRSEEQEELRGQLSRAGLCPLCGELKTAHAPDCLWGRTLLAGSSYDPGALAHDDLRCAWVRFANAVAVRLPPDKCERFLRAAHAAVDRALLEGAGRPEAVAALVARPEQTHEANQEPGGTHAAPA